MKKLVLVALFLLGFSMVAMAQDTPRFEVFGGYSLLMLDLNTMSNGDISENANLNGWNASVSINGAKWLGFLADFNGFYGNVGQPAESGDVRIYSMLFGPKVAIRKGAVTPFVQALFGYARSTANADPGGEQIFKENDFAMAMGGGVDVRINDKISIRPAQLDYYTIKSGLTGDFSNQFRFSTGVVFKLGKF